MSSLKDEFPLLWLLPMSQKLFSLSDIKKSFGLTKSQAIILIALYYKNTINMSQAAEYLSSSKEQATRAVSGIVKQGLAERFENPDNRTHVNLRLTGEGLKRIEAVKKATYARLSDRFRVNLTPKEEQQLRDAMNLLFSITDRVQ